MYNKNDKLQGQIDKSVIIVGNILLSATDRTSKQKYYKAYRRFTKFIRQ